jgi:hypothetical protein
MISPTLGAVSLGIPSSDPYIRDGHVVLNMTGGSACSVPGQTRSALLLFTCKPGDLGSPKFVVQTSSCVSVFEWASSAACVPYVCACTC